jgi:hypothetical protein
VWLTSIRFPMDKPMFSTCAVCTVIPRHESDTHPRFPAVESIIGTNAIDPIQDCLVHIKDRDNITHRFLVSFRFHTNGTKRNHAVRARFGIQWPGELLVMKVGVRKFVVGMRGRKEERLALSASRK